MPGLVVLGSTGTLYAYSTLDGRAVWQYDTARPFTTVNGVEATGGNINAAGRPASPTGWCSRRGVRRNLGSDTGNVLLAFGVK